MSTIPAGWGVEIVIWFVPVLICDLDGGGRAEVVCKRSYADPPDAEGM